MAPAPGALGVARERLPLVVAGIASLVLGTLAGLARSGLELPAMHASVHAPLMIGGFLGTVIALERAVALGAKWGYLAPSLAALAALALWIAPNAPTGSGASLASGLSLLRVAAELQLIAGALLAIICWRLHARQPATHSRVLVLAALCWPAGNAIWIFTGDPGRSALAWISFLVLTIAAERLELSRFMPSRAHALAGFFGGVFLCVLAVVASPLAGEMSELAMGGGTMVLAIWLARNDIARRTARLPALAGYIGRSLLAGYFWLALGGALLVLSAAGVVGAHAAWLRDAWLHSLLLGFVMSMVFAHAPVVFPAVLRVRMPWHWSLYLPPLLLHVSLALRVGADLASHPGARAAGSLGNALALGAFVLVTISAVIRGARARRS